ncbi:MAG: hypothetical protein F2704_03060 [Actinobacteria bacterium]|uniref:Unannotated protein n=1 Tax=freshwater metagenome TaxID=449393 RepID=A0A6J7E1M4_9ZZZZ|nr:hypothetical protein [Actinomycetota bacterium]MSW48000.1 hypothetical protein [Actinomycetota bacterium]MSX25367.1 hypothetical protein [Actinomycetota bacterium]MSY46362.1 hypothetical protein [Actinomycetota bacterium]MSY57235.1 hypothetical protein [Actinomycetota bacterium]
MGTRIKGKAIAVTVAMLLIFTTQGAYAGALKVWPPPKSEKWTLDTNLYFRIPSAAEQKKVLQNKYEKKISPEAMKTAICHKYACGVIQVIATLGCKWWEIDSVVSRSVSLTDKSQVRLGTIRTIFGSSTPHQKVTVWMVSREPLQQKMYTTLQDIYCYQTEPTEKLPSNKYTRIVVPTPASLETPSETPTPQNS